jgi:adenylyltransferase/sulfurtransferase
VVGQKRLKNARVLVIGAGGLGSPTLLYLAAAGVGTIGVVEFDVVDESNLQRQIIHGQSDIGRSKAQSARDSILELNPLVTVRLHEMRLQPDNAVELFGQYDLIIDGTDNFATRYLVNDAAVLARKPYVWGSIYRFAGQVSVFWEDALDGLGLNYRDLYPSRRRRAWCRPVPRAACWASCAPRSLGDGHRGHQADHRYRRTAAGPVDDLRRPGDELPHHQDPQGSRDPRDHRADRLRGVLRGAVREAPPRPPDSTLTPLELRDLLESGTKVALIDVREPVEWDINHQRCRTDPEVAIESGQGLARLLQDRIPVLYCKTGVRSAGGAGGAEEGRARCAAPAGRHRGLGYNSNPTW